MNRCYQHQTDHNEPGLKAGNIFLVLFKIIKIAVIYLPATTLVHLELIEQDHIAQR